MFLFLMRIFKLLDFQPQMGILTRTISRAMDDLMHFFLLLILVLMMYVCMGTIIFGPTLEVFSSMTNSLQTVFDMLLGEFGDTEVSRASFQPNPRRSEQSWWSGPYGAVGLYHGLGSAKGVRPLDAQDGRDCACA